MIRCTPHVWSVAMLCVLPGLIVPLEAPAQDPELVSSRTSVAMTAPAVPITVFASDCPTFESSSCDYSSVPESETCEVVSFDSLGSAGGRQYWLGRYLRAQTFGSDERFGAEEWTCESDEILLLEDVEPERARPVWVGSADRTYESITSAGLFQSPSNDVFSVTYCLNGTGGCSQQLLVLLDGEWRQVERDSTWDAIYAQLPEGYRPHKSPPIDLESLRWEHHVAGPHDANCCPSGRLHLDLGLNGRFLTIRKARLEIELLVSGPDSN